MNKHMARIRRGLKTKAILRHSNRPRLVVHRTSLHIYAQIVVRDPKGDKVLVSASTLDKALKPDLTGTKTANAEKVGKLLAERAKAEKIEEVAFDRAGYKYHGRVKALADAAREAGLNF